MELAIGYVKKAWHS